MTQHIISNPISTHIQQYSLNARSFKGLNYKEKCAWDININHPPTAIADEIAAAIHSIAEPFFSRFTTITIARDAIAENDSWCFGGKTFWRQLLLLDLALDDLEHFNHWAKRLTDSEKDQANRMIEKLILYCLQEAIKHAM